MERDDSQLVEHLGWVQRLALSLARDRDAADDLAQDVARVWLEKRPALADGPRAWLAAVARRLALDRARSEVSRKARERSTADPEGEGYEVVERGARQRRVVEAVMQLAEPYRSTILYRYLDGLSTREVAERMQASEPAVRKRIERGLALLRERLDREFGSRSSAWAIGLLEPGLRSALLKGAGIMGIKWIAAAGAVALVAGLAWYLHGSSVAGPSEAIGGTGVVVPLEVAAAREQPPPAGSTRLENPNEVQRTSANAARAPAPKEPGLRGFIFVDEVHVAPSNVTITRLSDDRTRVDATAKVDESSARWSLDTLGGEPGQLWVTSGSTVPALIPVPPGLWATGGEFDLHLSTGRTLVLTFLDRETKAPLPNLEFQFSSSIEVERSRGRVSTRSHESMHRTDAQGKSVLTGAALAGYVSVTVDFRLREREIVMKGGGTMRMRSPREPDWGSWFKEQQPARSEQTILVSAPLGEACADGRVPAWAIALAGGAEAVRAMARDTTNETPYGRSMPFLLPADAQGRFELCANAPATLVVWLERSANSERLSAETELVFTHPGAQDPITFRELQGKQVTLHFVHVPEHGELQVWTSSKGPAGVSVSLPCNGSDFTREFTLVGDEQIQLALRQGSDPHEKSGWTSRIKVEAEREIRVDLGGCERTVRLVSPELGGPAGEGAVIFVRCEAGEASLDQTIVALCSSGRGLSPVHIPNGRWLYRYDDVNQVAAWGMIDIATVATPGDELVLRPRLRLATVAEIQPGIRFDEIEGVSLAKLPEKLRTASAKGGSERVALPLDAKYVTLEGK